MSLATVSDLEDVARAALAELTPDRTVGNLLDRAVEEDGVATLSFEARLSGYPGWHWSVSLVELPGEEATVLEAELLPGPGALLAPEWVPWAERLEEYRAAQAAAAERADDSDETGEGDLGEEDLDDDLGEDDLDDDLGDGVLDDDDLGDDPDDGIDFESDDSAVPHGRVDEQDESEDESDDDRPEEPAEA